MMARLIESEGRWIRALLILSTVTVGLLLAWLVAQYVVYFSDIILVVVLAWLFAFVLSPLVTLIRRALPVVPRNVVVVSIYALLFLVLSTVVLLIAAQLANSIAGVRRGPARTPGAPAEHPRAVPGAARRGLGFEVDLVKVANEILTGIGDQAVEFVGPLQQIALASLATIGNLLFMIFLSLFIVIDKERLITFVNRVTPPRFADEMRLFQTSVASSFGGFIRGQAIQGVVYGAIAAVGSVALGIDYAPLTTALVAIFQIIPFFGPFVSWAPPVVAAILTQPTEVIPILVIMVVGWFIVMNIVQPRVMASSVGIHPIVVLVSVLIGLRLYGVVGAIFAIPVAAVISAFFFHYLNRSSGEPRDVTSRAARRVEERQGRPVRVPAPPIVSASTSSPLATATGLAGGVHGSSVGLDEPGRLTLPTDRRERPATEGATSGTTRSRGPPQGCATRPGATVSSVEPRPQRAARDRPRARRAAGGRQAASCADPDAASRGPSARRVGSAAAHPRDERRRHRVARAARAQEGARADRGHVRRRARDQPVGRRTLEDVHAAAARPGAGARRRNRSAGRSTAPRPMR